MSVRWWTEARLVLVMALLFGALYGAQLWLHATSTSATVDEPVHMLAGYRHVTCGDYAFNPEHPPLVKQVAALPLLGSPLKLPNLPCDAGFTSKPDSFQLGNRFLVDNGVYRILLPARFAVFVFSLLLAGLLYLVARRMLGGCGPAIALGLLAMEPVLIAHGSLVTTDMAISAATLAVVWTLYRAREWRPWVAIVAVGLALGFMLTAKHSALVILPGVLLAFLLDTLRGARRAGGAKKEMAGKFAMLAASGLVALALLWASYEFRYSATPHRAGTVVLDEFLAKVGRPGISESTSAQVLGLMQATRLFPESYLMGLADIIGTGERPSRILGKVYDSGQWFYFPIALSLKSSIPLLFLFPVGIAALWRQERRRELLYLTVPPLAYLLACLTSGINIGVRHVLPVYPFLILLSAAGAQSLWRRRGAWRWLLAFLLGYHAVTLARTAPDYLPFANALWGGTERAHEVLQDANVEWGQSLRRVEQYVARQGIRECWYAGVGAPMLHRAEQPCRLLPDGYRWVVVDPLEPAVPPRIRGTIFLSVRMLPPRGGREYQPLLDAGATRMLAGTLLVFEGDFDLPLVAALSHARRTDALVVAGRIKEAVVESNLAIALAPDDPRVRISVANALLRDGSNASAYEHARTAQRQFREEPALYGFVRPRLDAVLRATQTL